LLSVLLLAVLPEVTSAAAAPPPCPAPTMHGTTLLADQRIGL